MTDAGRRALGASPISRTTSPNREERHMNNATRTGAARLITSSFPLQIEGIGRV